MKLRHYSIRGRSLGLLESYLRRRVQNVDTNGESPGSRCPPPRIDIDNPRGATSALPASWEGTGLLIVGSD
ncbi:hypothetical protein EVAR_81524_1 [Eumeta japonica]|uniref:Uncharacterized protein n=1 Tax=Eumeta variegata TaxID=151549 RepID=A0A4C1VZS1_EUMVA|nr:hypothetical protein EVAR_81524_1 [Eumeta japonica]